MEVLAEAGKAEVVEEVVMVEEVDYDYGNMRLRVYGWVHMRVGPNSRIRSNIRYG